MPRSYDFDAGYSSQQNAGLTRPEYPDRFTCTADVTNSYAIGEITNATTIGGIYSIQKPSADSLEPAKCALMPASRFTSGQYSFCSVIPTKPMLVAYDTAAGAVAAGDEIGSEKHDAQQDASQIGVDIRFARAIEKFLQRAFFFD